MPPDPMTLAFAAVVRERRQRAGWSLQDLATRAGLHRTSLGLVERGRRGLTLEAAQAVALALDEPLSVLVEEAEARLV